MRDPQEIQSVLNRVNQEASHEDINEDSGIVSVQDALRWVTDPNLPADWLDGYFKER